MRIFKTKMAKKEREAFDKEFDKLLECFHGANGSPEQKELLDYFLTNPIAETLPMFCFLHSLTGEVRHKEVDKVILVIE